MATPIDPGVLLLQSVIAANLSGQLEGRGMKGADLARQGRRVNKKSVYNALNAKHPISLKKLVDYAEKLRIPPWTLLIDGLQNHPELQGPGALNPLASLVENYLATDPDKRLRIERMAQATRDESEIDKKQR